MLTAASPAYLIRRGLRLPPGQLSDVIPNICRRQLVARTFANSATRSAASSSSWSSRPPLRPQPRLAARTALKSTVRQWTQSRTASALASAHTTEPFATVQVRHAPSVADLEDAEVDAEPLAPSAVELRLTDRAAEQLRAIAAREGDDGAALRIGVESGGCHGYQYKMDLASLAGAAPEDYHLVHPTIAPGALLVDAVSLPLLNGATVDFSTELIGSAFRVVENPHAAGKGCGCGVSWELKL